MIKHLKILQKIKFKMESKFKVQFSNVATLLIEQKTKHLLNIGLITKIQNDKGVQNEVEEHCLC